MNARNRTQRLASSAWPVLSSMRTYLGASAMVRHASMKTATHAPSIGPRHSYLAGRPLLTLCVSAAKEAPVVFEIPNRAKEERGSPNRAPVVLALAASITWHVIA